VWFVGAAALALGAGYIYLSSRAYNATEAATVAEFAVRQRVLAQEAARGIEFYFNTLTKSLRPLALDPAIQALDEAATRRDLKLKSAELSPLGVWDVGVFDASGKLRYSATDTAIEGADFSSRRYYLDAKAARSTDSRVVEFVVMERAGSGRKGLFVGVPMFTGNMVEGSGEPPAAFVGIVACVANLDYLANEFVASATMSAGGHAFLLDDAASILWCVDPTSVGRNIVKDGDAFPELVALARRMQAGESGTGEFVYHRLDAATKRYLPDATERKLVGFAPIRVADKPWSIGVWAPKADALALLRSARRAHQTELAVVILVLLAAAGSAIVLLSRINRVLDHRVRHRTRQIEESQCRLRHTLDQVEASEREMAAATKKVSELIDTAAREQVLGTYYDNPHLVTCWRERDCKHSWCPVHGREGVRCWQVEGTYCDRERATSFAEKVLKCRECVVYRKSCPDRLTELAEGFNNMMCLLARKAEELRHVRYQAIERERMATIGQMAAGIAHEISNPMASLFSLVQLLRSAPLDDHAKENVALMQTCIERIARTVREIVDFGRPATKEEWTLGSVERIVRDTVNLLRYDRRARRLDIAVEFEPGLPSTLIIEHQLQQVFTNLMVNAFDAMHGQGKLSIRGWRADGAIDVAIADTGEGMRPEQMSHIFEPFYTTKAGQKGTGLGLALSYSIMQRHGGTIKVESQLGKGSTFTVSIPIRSPAADDIEERR